MSKPFLTLVCFCFKPICEFCFKQKNNFCLEKCFKQSIGNRFKQICKRTLSIETKQNNKYGF